MIDNISDSYITLELRVQRDVLNKTDTVLKFVFTRLLLKKNK